MVVHPRPENIDLSLAALFVGWAMADEVQRRLAVDGFGELRFNDGLVIQHVLAAPLSITALAERMNVSQQAASKAVADLERRGLLTRKPSPNDARAKLLYLTGYGQAAVDATRRHRAALDTELANEFGQDRITETRALLAELLSHFNADDPIRRRTIRPPT
jgi:DNA-binding MarR family transcriptional regulator